MRYVCHLYFKGPFVLILAFPGPYRLHTDPAPDLDPSVEFPWPHSSLSYPSSRAAGFAEALVVALRAVLP